jgi:hypothetical protein
MRQCEVGQFNAQRVTGGGDMTAIRTERPNGGREAAQAPTDVAGFEGEIREFIRRDVTPVRRVRGEPQTAETATEHVNMLLARVAGASMEEIDRVILELQSIRDMLRSEGERVTRDIAGYASLSHAAMTSMRVIADSLEQWKNGAKLRPDQQR